MERNGLFGELIGEVFGTFILILLGDGVVANVGLAPRLAAGGYNWNTITIGWAMAVIIAVYVSGGVSGAHLNPAVTLAMAAKRGFAWAKVVPYWIAQMVGAFLGALGVLIVGGTVLAVGLSLGGPSVYSINPARDLGPRIFGALAGTKGLFDGIYWLLAPVLMPLVGGLVGVFMYDAFITT